MVNTRRSFIEIPTIAVARALRRERRARIAEAELLPHPKSIAPRSNGGKRAKSADAASKLTNRDRSETQASSMSLDPIPEDPSLQDPSNPSTQATTLTPSPDEADNPPPSTQPRRPNHWADCNSGSAINSSQDVAHPSGECPVRIQSPDASPSPPPSSHPQGPPKSWYQREPTPQLNFSPEPESSQGTVRPPSTLVPTNAPDSSWPLGVSKPWFGAASVNQVSLPDSAAPIFQPAESLIQFATGVPAPEERKPFDCDSRRGGANDGRMNEFNSACDAHEGVSAYLARRQATITRAATAVMAHMNGQDVARSDYLSILDGMLADPEIRVQLPPVLIERYDAALNEEPTTIYNGGLIDKFVHATARATNVTARILLKSKKTKRDRRVRGMRHRSFLSDVSSIPSSTEHCRLQSTSASKLPGLMASASVHSMAPPSSNPSASRFFPEPLTEANLNRGHDHSLKGKAKDNVSLCDEDRGVMRTMKGSIRAAPYPRRESHESLRMGPGLAGSTGNMHTKDMHDDCGYSVYSASSGFLHQQTEVRKVAQSMLDGVKSMRQPDSYDAQCVRNAEAILEETAKCKGAEAAASVKRGFDLLHCYDLVRQVNVELLSDALLEHLAEAPKPPTNQLRPSSSAPLGTSTFADIPEPPPQLCEHAQFGWGFLSFAKVFKPLGSNHQYTEPIHPSPLS